MMNRHPHAPARRGVETIDDLRGLAELGPEWERLRGPNAWPMQHHAWALSCAEAFVAPGDLRVVTCRHGGELVAVAPLVASRQRRGALMPLGGAELYEPCDLLAGGPDALAQLTRAIARRGGALVLSRTPAKSPTIAALRRAYRGRGGAVATAPAKGAPFVALHDGWREPESQLSARRRSDLRRAMRRAERLGSVTVELRAPSGDEVASLLAEALAVEASGWKARNATAVVADEAMSRFFAAWAPRAASLGQLRIALLRIAGQAVAAQISIECANRLWLLKIGYDEAVGSCSPGTLLLAQVVGDAAARGLDAVELLGEVEPWTHVWTEEAHELVSVRALLPTRSGFAELAHSASRVVARRQAGSPKVA